MKELNPKNLRRYLLEQELMFLAGQPVVYHCHHFNLFLDQTIDDALGAADGQRLRMQAAREFAAPLLRELCRQAEAQTPPERIQLAMQVLRTLGHGTLDLDAGAQGGMGRGSHLHYGHAWHEKYGARVRRRDPADAFAAGFGAAALEVAFDLPAGSINGKEERCVAMREPGCEFTFRESGPERDKPGALITDEISAEYVGPPEDGLYEDVIQPICQGLKEFTAGVAGDERGLVQAFGVFVTMHLAGYYNRISYDAVQELERRSAQSVGVMEDLLRESGHVCVFNTFGGILLSPEWEGLVGPVVDDPEKILAWCMAIARSLGMGRWTVSEFEPGKRLVMRTSSSYESVYYRKRHGVAPRPMEYLLQGAALATAQLVHRVEWMSRPQLTPEYYQQLFKGGIPWRFEQTKAIVCGDRVSEVVVTHV